MGFKYLEKGLPFVNVTSSVDFQFVDPQGKLSIFPAGFYQFDLQGQIDRGQVQITDSPDVIVVVSDVPLRAAVGRPVDISVSQIASDLAAVRDSFGAVCSASIIPGSQYKWVLKFTRNRPIAFYAGKFVDVVIRTTAPVTSVVNDTDVLVMGADGAMSGSSLLAALSTTGYHSLRLEATCADITIGCTAEVYCRLSGMGLFS